MGDKGHPFPCLSLFFPTDMIWYFTDARWMDGWMDGWGWDVAGAFGRKIIIKSGLGT